jgi:class 3 adenylate cyclase/tetratricopeptide (TPR) repeat protein
MRHTAAVDSRSVTCPSCRADVPPGARFCADCGQDLRLRGDERRVVTVLFADLVGYTSMSETRDPEQVKNLIDGCFEQLVADIDAFGGRVDKIIGDAIVALFGAPVAHEDDAERAVRAALRMQTTLARTCAELGFDIRMRIGVNTGEVLVGALRSGGDYTAMGDVVNTANRLQTAAPPGEVLVGPATYAATRRVVSYEALEPIDAKGREERVPAWRAVDAVLPPGYRPERNRASLVGREAELGLLRHSVDNAVRNTRAGLLLVMGEAGVGKSRLAEELASVAETEHNALVLEGRCVPYGEANVWWPVADALRHGCGIRSSDPEDVAIDLAVRAVRTALGDAPADEQDRVLQGLLFLMGFESELRGIDATRAREEATDAVVAFTEHYSKQQPVVVVLSDLHWADDVVLELVDTLLERLCTRRFVVLATARRAIEERWHPPHGRHNLVVLTLDALNADASAALLCELAGQELDVTLAAALLERSGGNPFFLEELVTLLGEAGVVGGHSEVTELPDTLRGLVAARLDGLTADERRVLDDCAVLGRRGPVRAIEVMAEKHSGIDDVRPVLEALEAKELLVLSGTGAAEKWTFRSDMVREVSYSTLTKTDRAKAHTGIASWMEVHEDPDKDAVLDRITHHYVRAAELVAELGSIDDESVDVTERALHWLERAASRADQSEMSMVAERLYGEGLRLLAGQHGPQHRNFLTGRARALAQLRELAAARSDAEAAIEESRAAGDDGERCLARALLALADIDQKEQRWDESEAALAEAAATFGRLGDSFGEAEVQRLRGFGALFRHDYDSAIALLEDARHRFDDLGDRRGVAWAEQNLAWCAFYLGRAAEAEERLRIAAATFDELGDSAGKGWAIGLLAWTRFQQGHSLEAEAMAVGMLDETRRRDRWALGMMLVLIGSVRLWTGRAAEAIPSLEEAREIFHGMDDTFGRAQADAVLGRALVSAGRIAEGFAILPGSGGAADIEALGPENAFALISTVNAAVQTGDVERTAHLLSLAPDPVTIDNDVLVADTERAVAVGLHQLQVGDVEGALAGLERTQTKLAPTVDPNLQSAVALVRAAAGQADAALADADLVDDHDRASYLDRLIAGLARAIAHDRRGDHPAAVAAFDQVLAAAEASEDVVTGAVVALADAVAASARGEADAAARLAKADDRLAELGLEDTAWRRAFRLALDISSAA